MILDTCTIDGPIGPLKLMAHGDALVACEFAGRGDRSGMEARRLERHMGGFTTRAAADPAGAATRLARYFAGDLAALAEQPVEMHGTEFQVAIWSALREIPAGTTWTYSQIAAHIGRPAAVRAAGAANGANPIAVFVPCHRVIAADRTLWGYGGGLERKRWLLLHEGAAFADRYAQEELLARAK